MSVYYQFVKESIKHSVIKLSRLNYINFKIWYYSKKKTFTFFLRINKYFLIFQEILRQNCFVMLFKKKINNG